MIWAAPVVEEIVVAKNFCLVCNKNAKYCTCQRGGPFIGDPYCTQPPAEAVDHPAHYGGADNPYEAIKVIRAWGLGFNLGNAIKYMARAGKKNPARTVEDLKKARWYLDDEIRHLEEGQVAKG